MKIDLSNDKLYNTLIKIKERPKMWLSDKTLSALSDYIHGYFTGTDVPSWYDYFGRYVSENCPDSIFCGNIFGNLIKNGYSGEEGFDFFFELLSKFSIDFVTKQKVSQPAPKAYAVKLSFLAVSHLAASSVRSHARDLFAEEEEEDLTLFATWNEDKTSVTMVLGNKNNMADIIDKVDSKSLPLVETNLDCSVFTEVRLD